MNLSTSYGMFLLSWGRDSPDVSGFGFIYTTCFDFIQNISSENKKKNTANGFAGSHRTNVCKQARSISKKNGVKNYTIMW